MKKLLLFLGLIASLSIFSQSDTAWRKFDIFAGMNTPMTGVPLNELKLTPIFGVAISDDAIIMAGISYYDIDNSALSEFFTLGFIYKFYKNFTISVRGSYGVDDAYSYSILSPGIGLHRNIGKYFFVAPTISFNKYFGDVKSSDISTGVTIGFRFPKV